MVLPERKRAVKKRKRRADWSDGCTDILWKIIERLSIADYIRFGAVCISWRAALAEKRSLPAPQLPWLILREPCFGLGSMVRFFSISDNREYCFRVPEIFRRYISGSSNGWLISLGVWPLDISIFNPISRDYIILPIVATLPGLDQYQHRLQSRMQIKVIVSPNQPIVAVAIRFNSVAMAFARGGEKSWTPVATPGYQQFCDILFYKRQLCGLTRSGTVVICDFVDVSHPKFIFAVRPSSIFNKTPTQEVIKSLMEFSGDLLQVHREVSFETVGKVKMTTDIKIFKLGQDYKWISLKNIGGHAFFFGHNPTLTFSTQDFPELRRNCIYLTNTSIYGDSLFGDVVGDLRIYRLRDGSVKPFPYQVTSYKPPMFWFTPKL